MQQLEFKFCRLCGDQINDLVCYKCGTLNYEPPVKKVLSDEYLEVIKQEVEALDYEIEIRKEDGTFLIEDKDPDWLILKLSLYLNEEDEDFEAFAYSVYKLEDIDSIEKLSEFLLFLKEMKKL